MLRDLQVMLKFPLVERGLKDAIKSLACRQTIGVDGLPNKFNKENLDFLCSFLILFGGSLLFFELV